jgi:hypothetical protein
VLQSRKTNSLSQIAVGIHIKNLIKKRSMMAKYVDFSHFLHKIPMITILKEKSSTNYDYGP